MKNCIFLLLICITIHCAYAQTKHEWKVTLKVMNEAGSPVMGAKVGVNYYTNRTLASMSGPTDADGFFTVSHLSYGGEIGFVIEKSGYYATKGSHTLGFSYDPGKWSLSQTVVLKKIGKPVAMYAKSVNLGMPAFDKPIGYDLEVGDWVGPFGKGVNRDILFTGHFNDKINKESDYTLTVTFPNPTDGLQEFTTTIFAQEGPYSELRSSHEAPLDGYQSEWVQANSQTSGKMVGRTRDAHHNYYIRVRTKIDDRGNIVSAHYGKIYGDFMQFKHYLNPTINDRNVEFDPKQNLLQGLKQLEQVKEP
jgi:hypothetical protein